MTDEPLDTLRVLSLTTDSISDVMHHRDPGEAARDLIARQQPSLRELAAARRENLEPHGGGSPDILIDLGLPGRPVLPEVLSLRRSVDEQLATAINVIAPN